jgi:N-acetylglucosamine kinase-like BadF-type ATPase
MNKALLAIDVGGSTSRATLVDHAGRCLGQGRNRGGNPASNTPEQAASAIISAVEAAVADAGGPLDIELALIALAGPRAHVAQDRLEAAFRENGLSGPLVFAGDLEAMLASVTAARDGYCIVAGTGAGAVRVRNGSIEAVVDAAGWLLGDLGSGYWLGHHAAIAVTAELLGAFGIAFTEEKAFTGRQVCLQQFVDAVYKLRPIELARFAPLVIANRTDPVAAALLAQSEAYLLADFKMIFDPGMPGPVALGGGIAPHLLTLPAAVSEVMRAAGHTPDVRIAGDGSVGAVVLALRAIGVAVDDSTVATVAASMAERAARPAVSA